MFFLTPRASSVATPCVLGVYPDSPPIITNVDWRVRKVPLKKGSIRGFHPGVNGGSEIQFESLLECQIISALADQPGLVNIESQPFTVHFQVDGRSHRYTPDLLVTFSEISSDLERRGFQRMTLVECKPRAKLQEVSQALCRARGAIQALTSIPLLVIVDSRLTPAVWEVTHAA